MVDCDDECVMIQLSDLDAFCEQLVKAFPNLTYLSMLKVCNHLYECHTGDDGDDTSC